MKIIADTNIPLTEKAFADFGEITKVSGREINNEILHDADILLVRSITKVNEELLKNTKVKFVGTATIGVDHIDENYLKDKNIGFASAPGSNADSVAEYIVSALLIISKNKNISLNKLKIGIVGLGNVGNKVKKRVEILGLTCLINDPPKQQLTNDKFFLPLNKVLNESDIVTVHVPLNITGLYPTFHLINDNFISQMKPGAILINTSRGKVMDENSIKANIKNLGGLILDVWENEPNINLDTLNITDIATPHIAGYSFDGKIHGTEMIYKAACNYFKIKINWISTPLIKPEKNLVIDLTNSNDLLFDAVINAYQILNDDYNLRKIKKLVPDLQGKYYDDLRKNYPIRREFFNYTLIIDKNKKNKETEILKKLGFNIKYK